MSSRIRLAVAGLLLAWGPATHAGVAVGEKFPALEAAALAGDPLPALAGKVVLVDFWASWCAPCKASFPSYARLHADYASRGLVVLGISADENPAAYAAFVRRLAPPFPTVRDQDRHLLDEVDVPAMPTCYLLGRDGRVRYLHEGFHGAGTERAIRREIDALLAESPPSP